MTSIWTWWPRLRLVSMTEPDRTPPVLAVDTSTSVQVGIAQGSQILASGGVQDSRRHVEELSPLIDTTLADAGVTTDQLAAIMVGVGPGPFTGLRVGIVTARTLGAVLGIPVRGVCSLDVLAAQWIASDPPDGEFVVCTDARRREVYWARYQHVGQGPAGQRRDGPHVAEPHTLPALPTGGPGADTHAALTSDRQAPTGLDAGLLAALGNQLPDAGIEPLYLRHPDAAPPGRRKSVLARHPGPKAV